METNYKPRERMFLTQTALLAYKVVPAKTVIGSSTSVQIAYKVDPTQDSNEMITWVQQGDNVRKHARVLEISGSLRILPR